MRPNYFFITLTVLALITTACERTFEAPPLSEPTYTGDEANITLAKLKSFYANPASPTLIDVDYIVKATVTANDISGNIYKQIYIQDETAAINIGIDQNSIFSEYRVGQELYIKLKGLYIVEYGEQLQIGYANTQANRIPWEVFNYQAHKNKWPKEEYAQPQTITLDQLDQSIVNTLVRLENVSFVGGGELTFSEPDNTTNRQLKDANGRSIIVRNSSYASFAADKLPAGNGTVIGILSKFRNDWQLFIRSIDDCQDFDQQP